MAEPQGFAAAIEAAQRIPGVGGDVTSPFPLPLPPGQRLIDGDKEERIPGVAAFPDYEPHVELYNAANREDRERYRLALKEIVNGSAILRYEERHFTKEGDPLVLLCWLTYKAPKEKTQEEEEKEERGEPV